MSALRLPEPKWHCSVGYVLTGKDGSYCGRVGCAMPCNSQEDGWRKAIDWLRKGRSTVYPFLIHTFEIDVRFF
jgi:hypothetical protein